MRDKEFLELIKKDEEYNIKFDIEYTKNQKKAKRLTYEFNKTSVDDDVKRREILCELTGNPDCGLFVEPNFHCDYGFNIKSKGFALINYNVTILDTSPVFIGDGVLIGPGVVIACAGHGVHPEERLDISTSKPIHIEDKVWIGANSTVIGGVTIGKGSIIGAGSVVTKDIPEGVIAAENPCRVLRKITDKDKLGDDIII